MLEEHLDAKLTTNQVADAFDVKPVTVSSWVAQKRLTGSMPRNARSKGRTFRLRELLLFAQCADDEGASEQQLRDWWEKNKEVVSQSLGTGNNGTDVLVSNQ